MLRAKMALDAAAPASHKRKIQRPTDGRTGQRNQASGPFLRRFGANLRGEPFSDARGKFFKELFFGQILEKLAPRIAERFAAKIRSEEHTSELQPHLHI